MTEEEEETSVEDPEEGSNGGTSASEETGSETETVTEEEESIAAYPAFIAHSATMLQLAEECGFLDTTNSDYRECDDPEDT
ncbi:hypothetical protein [Candidatus Poriferisodalis sp.]|uniref:hypothetical protein n=1 Tax=Candidatus Poriferisodalis sp. TaxID=3101277 RepID=UPI003B52520B